MEIETWTEVEDNILTNQPVKWAGRAKGRIPDPDVEPTEIWLFTWDCTRTKRGIRRKRNPVVTLKGGDSDELDSRLFDFVTRDDVIVIEGLKNPREYTSYRGEPTKVPLGTI